MCNTRSTIATVNPAINGGPTRFTKLLRFESGRLVYVEEGAKGTPGGG